MTYTHRPVMISVTSMSDGCEHQLPSEHAIHNRALCGHQVIPAALVAPPGPPCPHCAANRNEALRRAQHARYGAARRLARKVIRRLGVWRRTRR